MRVLRSLAPLAGALMSLCVGLQEAQACACCTNTGQRRDAVETLTPDRLDEIGRLEIDVAAGNPGEHHFAFIGRGGEFLGESRGRSGRFALDYAPAGYVRAVVTDQAGQKAWIQPITVHGS